MTKPYSTSLNILYDMFTACYRTHAPISVLFSDLHNGFRFGGWVGVVSMYLLSRDRAGAGLSSLQMSVCAVFFCSEAQNMWLCPGSAAGGSSGFFAAGIGVD